MPYYYAIWAQAGQPSRANVSFDAKDDASAIKKANKIAAEVDSKNTPRTITCSGRIVQSLTKGVSDA